MDTFDKVSNEYKDKSLVQKGAAAKLLELLKIRKNESVIDIACGPGNITAEIKKMTSEKVIGVDIARGMIEQASKVYPDIEFKQVSVEDMCYENEFDVAFCNSALQWFCKPEKAMATIHKCMKKDGRAGFACPATSNWTPFFERLVSKVKEKPGIQQFFSHWNNPWFHLPSKPDYEAFFAKNGFKAQHLEIMYEDSNFTVENAFGVYISGAANGYVGKQYYDIGISDEYINKFNAFIKEEMQKESKDGKVKVDFNRLYYVGIKQ